MSQLQKMLNFNQQFVENKKFEEYRTSGLPNKKLVVLSCMDTRLTELLPRALNLKNGDAKFVKNAGAVITHPFGSIMRSIIVAIYEMGAEEVCVIGHHGCGMGNLNEAATIEKMKDRGIQDRTLSTLEYAGIDLKKWLHGFENVEASIKATVDMIRNHPLIPEGVIVHGLVIHPETGKVDVVDAGIPLESEQL